MDEKAVREYVRKVQSVIEASPQMDEANTKAAVLRDFLELLEWKIPTNTQLEYSVKAFGKTYKVDYALVLEGTPVAFIEAKGVDTPLTDKHREQLAAYLKNEDVNWGILTNGREYEFYRRQVVNSKVNVNALGDTQLQNLSNKITILRAFTKEAIQTGDSEKIATRINELKEARDNLESEKDELATEITKLFSDVVTETISSRAESQAKEMIDRLIQDIEGEISSDGTSSSSVEEKGGSGSSENGTEVLEEALEKERAVDATGDEPFDISGRYVVKISDANDVIAAVSGQTQTESLIETTNYFIQNHELIGEISTPWVPAQNKAIINHEPEWENADPEYRQLIDGYYVDTKLSKGGKKREIRRMAGRCGLGVTFEGDW